MTIIKKFTHNGDKYVVRQHNDGHCVSKNGHYMCTKDVRSLVKEIKGGVIVNLSRDATEKNIRRDPGRMTFINDLEYYGPEPSFKHRTSGAIFKEVDQIGKGAVGKILKLGSSSDSRIFAIKVFDKTPEGRKDGQNEYDMASILNQRNALSESSYVRGIKSPAGDTYILMELGQGDIYSIRNSADENNLNECDCLKIVYGMFKEIENIYNKTGLLYSDTKPQNFLYTHDSDGTFHVIMTDYGSLANEGATPSANGINATYSPVYFEREFVNTIPNLAFALGASFLHIYLPYRDYSDVRIELGQRTRYSIDNLQALIGANFPSLLEFLTLLLTNYATLTSMNAIDSAFKKAANNLGCDISEITALPTTMPRQQTFNPPSVVTEHIQPVSRYVPATRNDDPFGIFTNKPPTYTPAPVTRPSPLVTVSHTYPAPRISANDPNDVFGFNNLNIYTPTPAPSRPIVRPAPVAVSAADAKYGPLPDWLKMGGKKQNTKKKNIRK